MAAAAPAAAQEGALGEGMSGSGWQHPPSFYCPISQRCMHDPVVLCDGHSYERRHIERWLGEHSTSPVSGLQLAQQDVFPNHALRNAIEEYFQQIFSVHRRAIRKTISAPEAEEALCSGASLLRTIDGLMQCSLLVHADLSTESVLRHIMDEAKALVGAEVASVFLLDTSRRDLRSTVNSTGQELRIPATQGIAGHVATTGEPVIVRDAYSDPRFSKAVDAATGFRTRNIMCVPLKAKNRGVFGVVQLINKTGYGLLTGTSGRDQAANDGHGPERPALSLEEAAFEPDDLQFLQVFASQAATAITSSGALDEPPADRASGSEPCRMACECLRRLCFRLHGKRPEDKKRPVLQGVALKCVDESVPGADGRHPHGHEPELFLPASPIKASLDQEDRPGGPEVELLLAGAFDNWQFDAIELSRLTNNRPLSTLGVYLFHKLQLVEHFRLDAGKLRRFLAEIEHGYDDGCLYHNRTHAASVLHAMHAFMELGGVARTSAPAFGGAGSPPRDREPLVRMACLLAAAVHDFEHRGLSNDFLVKTTDERAVRYNDQHVNESHHVAAAFSLLKRPECDFLSELPLDDFKQLRSLVIDLVIATDMSSNAHFLQSFTQALDAQHQPDPASSGPPPWAFEPATPGDAVLLLQMAMKCADLGHLTLSWEAHLQWVSRLQEEFFRQGDRERDLGLPISFLMDRNKPGASETQVGFFEYVVLPLFGALARAVPSARPVMDSVKDNFVRWRDREEAKKIEEHRSAGSGRDQV
mmetsp:Transcript_80252/g.227211  ORF Transcript_80252/g.227211 Transcript_80252/m.227211 type:complete len:757 (-) Transcript_80252:125-2395(-)